METRQFCKLADQLGCFEAVSQWQLEIGSIVSHPLWIKCLWLVEDREHLFAWHIFWFSLVELDNTMLDDLFPLCPHRLVSDFCIHQGHFWAGVSHPLLYHKQRHSIVHQFHPLGMPESVKLEMEKISCLITNLILFDERVQRSSSLSDRRQTAVFSPTWAAWLAYEAFLRPTWWP